MGAQNFNAVPNFLPKMTIFNPLFRNFVRTFSDRVKFSGISFAALATTQLVIFSPIAEKRTTWSNGLLIQR